MSLRWWLNTAAKLFSWGCVYPGCGAVFDTYVEMEQHRAGHY
ncbi:hypothetical protein [Streptomyces sp. NBC_00687]|nr:hypothetical protein [Streptomyces sp. NBC_00687]MCX4912858.1 hypothetical protein [Streptomyces sp. NBC_00687]